MSMINQCTKQRVDNGVLYVEVDLECMVKLINVPIKSSRYTLNGSTLTIEVVPDVESILNTVLNR
jgi:hypothetical protein